MRRSSLQASPELTAVSLVSLLVLAVAAGAAPTPEREPTTVTEALRAWTDAHPRTGAAVWRLADGAPVEIASFRPESGFAPASTMKIVTAASALINLGADFRFETRLVAGPQAVRQGATLVGPVYVKGFGDPVLATPPYARKFFGARGGNLGRLVGPLRALGVRRVRGPIVADESFFDTARGGPLWEPNYVSESPPLTALAINQSYRGDVRGPYVSNPPLFAARRVQGAMKALGIAHKGQLRVGRMPDVARPLATVQSPQLQAIVGIMLPSSDNFIAEMLMRGVGAYTGTTGTTAGGAEQTTAILSGLGALAPEDRVVDGSGLSRSNRLTAGTLVRLLAAADAADDWGAPLVAGLPNGGEGTLIRRLKEPGVARRVRAKTGYINGVSSLAGLVTSTGGQRYAFALLMNDPDITGAHETQDLVARLLARGAADSVAGTAVATSLGAAAAARPAP